MPADTVAKLLHEWRNRTATRPTTGCLRARPSSSTKPAWSAPAPSTRSSASPTSQRWRLVLVGDPRQLQAVGRGGMFDELCRTGRIHELATIHRFRHAWEQAASLQLRRREPRRARRLLRPRPRHRRRPRRRSAPTSPAMDRAHRRRAQSVAVIAETNEHVDALNEAIQKPDASTASSADRAVPIAGGEAVAVGDIVVTRRNDRNPSHRPRRTRPQPRPMDRHRSPPRRQPHRVARTTDTGTSPSPPTTCASTSGSATPPPPTATKATPSTSASPSSPKPRPTAASTSAPPEGGTRTASSSSPTMLTRPRRPRTSPHQRPRRHPGGRTTPTPRSSRAADRAPDG